MSGGSASPGGGGAADASAPGAGEAWDAWTAEVDRRLVDYYAGETAGAERWAASPAPPGLAAWRSPEAKAWLGGAEVDPAAIPFSVGALRGRAQQALVLEIAAAAREGRTLDAQRWRARLGRPRGVSGKEGALALQNLMDTPARRADAAKLLTREAVTWQTTRARQLLDEATRAAGKPVPLPGRVAERLGEAAALSDLPPALAREAGLPGVDGLSKLDGARGVAAAAWADLPPRLADLRRGIESALPSLLSDEERSRRERLLLKLVILAPQEYAAGVRDGVVSVPLEYREAVGFTAQARQLVGELAPHWIAADAGKTEPLRRLEAQLQGAGQLIDAKADEAAVRDALGRVRSDLEGPLGISLSRPGTTTAIVTEVMLDTRTELHRSLAAALAGNWRKAEDHRLEAYTTYDPELEARLMPRDPQLAKDIERLFLDGLDEPGIKVLLDARAGPDALQAGYERTLAYLDRAEALLKSGIDPTAAAINAASIVLREGLEGLLVIVAILAGLRGAENRDRRRLMWLGILASLVASVATYVLSRTVIVGLQRHGEVLEAVTCLLAIAVLLLITNWLFHQIYWNRWVHSLKAQAHAGEAWKLVSVGFLIGYREGFETTLFLQSLVLDVGGLPVGLGVFAGGLVLAALGVAALLLGLRLPYFKLLLVTAASVGFVLFTFVGTGVRLMQTVGWLPVHKVFHANWPVWLGQWFGLYNTAETFIAQIVMLLVVLGTWRFSRWNTRRQARANAAARGLTPVAA